MNTKTTKRWTKTQARLFWAALAAVWLTLPLWWLLGGTGALWLFTHH